MSLPGRWPVLLPSVLALLLATGCATVSERFSQNVQASFARDEMRKLRTRHADIYYPAAQRAAALRIAARMEQCVDQLREKTVARDDAQRMLVFLTSADFNNAYVQPELPSVPQQMVIPSQMGLELFHFFDLGAGELGDVGCHESVHYVQMQQVSGFWAGLNTLTGGLLQPNILTESWFLEGLATYHEGNLGARSGRPHSPVFRGWFAAAAAERNGRVDPGFLNPDNRALDPFGGNYVSGEHFVEWLAKTYGEDKLWKLVDVQGDSVFSPLGVTLRFKSVYGLSIGGLFDQFQQQLAREPRRERPEGQQVLARDAGYFGRLAAAPDGTLAVISQDRERPVELHVYAPDGTRRLARRLTQFLPGRRYIATSPTLMSGLSFTPDARWLYLVVADVNALGDYVYRLWKVDAQTGDVVRTWEDLQGMGGSVTPDGAAYVYVRLEQGVANLVRYELASGKAEPLTRFEGPSSLGAPSVSPDGQRIAFSRWSGNGFDLVLREASGALRALTSDGLYNYGARWVDPHRLVFMREHEGRAQAHLLDVDSGELTVLSDAPYLAFDVTGAGPGRVAFLNRDGSRFTLDAVALPAIPASAQASLAPVAPEAEPPAAAPLPERTLPPLEPLSDEPYRPLENLGVPELHAPYVTFITGVRDADNHWLLRPGVGVGVSLAGQDRLGFHQYALNLDMDTQVRSPNVSLTYGNATLAPWYLSATASRTRNLDISNVRVGDALYESVRLSTTKWTLSAGASRTFWTTPVGLSLLAQREDRFADVPGGASGRRDIVGGSAASSWASGEGASYSGTQRGLVLSGSVGEFALLSPRQSAFTDLRASLTTFVELPLLARDNLSINGRGRTLLGPADGLLQVGGISSGGLYQSRGGVGVGRNAPDLPAVSFEEPVRGYEDTTVYGRNMVAAGANWRYRIPIDRGTASTLYLVGSFFLRQVDVDLFGEWARVDLSQDMRAAGAAVHLRMTFASAVNLSLYYQVAARFDLGRPPLHVVGITAN